METGKIPKKIILGIPIAALRLKEISSVVVRLIEEGKKHGYF